MAYQTYHSLLFKLRMEEGGDSDDEYCEDDILKLIQSKDLDDQKKLNNIIAEIVVEDESEDMRYLLEKGYKIDKINCAGETFLHRAFYQGGYGMLSTNTEFWVPYITEDVVNIIDCNGLTILHVACYAYGSSKLVEKCLECNANVNAIFGTDKKDLQRDGFTPVHFATVNFEGMNFMELLIKHNADVNLKDSRGRTPLHIACLVFEDPGEKEFFDAYTDALEFFLDNKADVNARDNDGNTPLLSLFPESYNIFKVLEYDVHIVPMKEIMLKFKILLKKGADLTLCNRYGENILHLIINNLEYYRGAGGNMFVKAKHLYSFHDNEHLEMVQEILRVCSNFDISVKNNLDFTPLQLAIMYLSADIVKVLLNYNSDHLDFDDSGYFYSLVTNRSTDYIPQLEEIVNFLEIFELLISKGFEVEVEEILEILEYLIHDTCVCKCGYFRITNEQIITDIVVLLNFSSSSHFKNLYDKLFTHASAEIQVSMTKVVLNNLRIRKYANFYVDSSLPVSFIQSKQLLIPVSQDSSAKLDIELNCMKSQKMKESITLYDVMCKHPHKIYQYLVDVKLESIAQNYSIFKDIIKGHLTKSLVRHYVEINVFDSLIELLPPSCPSLCSKMIMNYLTNTDILNVHKAVIEDE